MLISCRRFILYFGIISSDINMQIFCFPKHISVMHSVYHEYLASIIPLLQNEYFITAPVISFWKVASKILQTKLLWEKRLRLAFRILYAVRAYQWYRALTKLAFYGNRSNLIVREFRRGRVISYEIPVKVKLYKQ